jgi:hypothetical protein
MLVEMSVTTSLTIAEAAEISGVSALHRPEDHHLRGTDQWIDANLAARD